MNKMKIYKEKNDPPHKIPADAYVCFCNVTLMGLQYDNAALRDIARHFPDAFKYLRMRVRQRNFSLGDPLVFKNRVIRMHDGDVSEKHDVFVVFIPVRMYRSHPVYREFALTAIRSIEHFAMNHPVRILCMGDLMRFISDENAFEVGLALNNVLMKLYQVGTRTVIAHGNSDYDEDSDWIPRIGGSDS